MNEEEAFALIISASVIVLNLDIYYILQWLTVGSIGQGIAVFLLVSPIVLGLLLGSVIWT